MRVGMARRYTIKRNQLIARAVIDQDFGYASGVNFGSDATAVWNYNDQVWDVSDNYIDCLAVIDADMECKAIGVELRNVVSKYVRLLVNNNTIAVATKSTEGNAAMALAVGARLVSVSEYSGAIVYDAAAHTRVTYLGALYECIQTTTAGIVPTNTAYWAALTTPEIVVTNNRLSAKEVGTDTTSTPHAIYNDMPGYVIKQANNVPFGGGVATMIGTTSTADNTQTSAGSGITSGTGTICRNSVAVSGAFITTSFLIDLTGLSSSTTDLDIIGNGAGAAYLGQITTAQNGTIFAARMRCLEAPVGGVTDIDVYAATEATGAFDGLVTDLTEVAQLTSGAAWTLGRDVAFTSLPAADKYLYLTGGAGGTAAAYTAGIFLIELDGYIT
jgi:hypothetical protein